MDGMKESRVRRQERMQRSNKARANRHDIRERNQLEHDNKYKGNLEKDWFKNE